MKMIRYTNFAVMRMLATAIACVLCATACQTVVSKDRAILSPVTSKPASQGRIKTSHSEARVHIRFFDSSKGLFISCRGKLGASLPVNCLLD
jgi:hypothetical protein